MEISGRFVELLEPKTGQSAKGSWKKQDFIIETEDQFPKKICISNWNDKVDLSKLKKGDQLNISVNIESREYNGNWYTDIKVWKMDLTSGSDNTHSEGLPGLEPSGSGEMPWDPGEDSSEPDLPF
jgi:hypothetical protein